MKARLRVRHGNSFNAGAATCDALPANHARPEAPDHWQGLPEPRALEAFEPLIEAAEGFPALERATLAARSHVWMAFRVFDLDTETRSEEAHALGLAAWADVIRHVAGKGVSVRFFLSDFDPIGAPELHEQCWKTARALQEMSSANPGLDIEVVAARHENRVGKGLRVMFYPAALAMIESQRRELNDLAEDRRRATFAVRPGLWRHLRMRRNGRIVWRSILLPRLFPATHHQKLAIFDGTRMILGGLDVDERRYDDAEHARPAAETWHDVSAEVTGPAATDAARHFVECWNRDRYRAAADLRRFRRRRPDQRIGPEAVANALEMPPDEGQGTVDGPSIRFLRTLSVAHRRFLLGMSPATVADELERAHLALIRSARRLIYVETQFFRHMPIAEELAEAAARNPDLGLILVLPMAPENVAFYGETGVDVRKGEKLQAECLSTVREAFGKRAFFMSPVRPVSARSDGRDTAYGREIVYVHAKVAVADDAAAIVSSANLNGRSMRWDTEAGVLVQSPDAVAHLRRRLFAAWLPDDAREAAFGVGSAVATWREIAAGNLRRAPEACRSFLAPHDIAETDGFGQHIPLVPDELV